MAKILCIFTKKILFYRVEPPTEEEVAANVAMAQLKKVNAAKIETKRLADGGSLPSVPVKGAQSFPVYSEYHHGGAPPKDKD